MVSVTKRQYFPQKITVEKANLFKSLVIKDKIFMFNNVIKSNIRMTNIFRRTSFVNKMDEYSFYSRVLLVGLGYKNFVIGNDLYILVGDSNYIVYNIPEHVNVICKKNQIYLNSYCSQSIFDFISTVRKTKHINVYKGKGLILFKNFKFMKLKVGKKQKY